jgi:hypothetical protein
MLDLTEYAGVRKRRKLDIVEFWRPHSTEAPRKISLIYTPGKSVEQAASSEGVPTAPEPQR